MWSPLALLFIVGVAVADYEHGWKIGNEYQYLVRSRTLSGLDVLPTLSTSNWSPQYTGILMKAVLTIQSVTPDRLNAKITKCQYAQIHKELPEGWESHISDQLLQYRDLPMSDMPFVVKIKHGVVRDLIVDKNVPTWEVNIIKSIISQIQVDTQGENAKRNRDTQIPKDKNPYAMFLAMEDMVSGKCEVLYDIQPLSEQIIQNNPELVPLPELRGNGEYISVTKTKNFNRCEQRPQYKFVIDGSVNWGTEQRNTDKFLSKASVSRIIISGDLKNFAIQSAVTTSKVVISPNLEGDQQGTVLSKMNLTLVSVKPFSEPLSMPRNPESTGNLVYTYNNPFSQRHRRLGRPSISPNSLPESESSSADASSDSWGSFDEPHRHLKDNNARSSISASSMGSSEEMDNYFWQVQPKLEEAPENPMLPFFIGNNGKAISMAGGIKVVPQAQILIEQIATEMEDPNTMPDKDTLEKFTILARLIATMNKKQIVEMEGNLLLTLNDLRSDTKENIVRRNARAVIRDAVAQAGTGPALLTIIEWIEQRKIEGWEAAEVIARIPKTARMPTPEYVDKFFSLLTKPEVQQQNFLNTSVIISFGELVRRAQVANNSIEHNYPVDTFGRLISRRSDVVVRKYIPYLAEQLKRAIQEGDSPKIQTYIMGLGCIAHPKILSVFEPYLEGKVHVSSFQRLMMVVALSKLTELNPRLVRSVLFKLYLNTWERHEIRCAAVYLIMMKTNPPLNMLQRMAQFTNFDTNRHVNSAVKSAMESVAMLKRPEWQELARNARTALTLLNPSEYGFHYSQYFMGDADLRKHKLAYWLLLSYIGSEDTVLPNSGFLALQMSHGGFTTPSEDITYMVSSLKTMMDLHWNKHNEIYRSPETTAEKLAKMLNIEPEDPVQFEGNIKLETKYISRFLPFDNHTLDRIATFFMHDILLPQRDRNNMRITKLMSYDAIIGFPTETGLPFVCSLSIPEMTNMMFGTKELRLIYTNKLQGRMGFVTPFDGQQFIAGVDTKLQLFVPATMNVELNKNGIRVELRPSLLDPLVRMVHYSNTPYTAKQNIMSLQPILLEKTTQKVIRDVTKLDMDHIVDAVSIKAEVDRLTNEEKKDATTWMSKLHLLLNLCKSHGHEKYTKVDFYLKPLLEKDNAIIFDVNWDTMRLRRDANMEQIWTTGPEAPVSYNSQSDSLTRKRQFLDEVSKGISSGIAVAVDATIEIPNKLKNQWTIAVAPSDIERKYRTVVAWRMSLPQSDAAFEICATTQAKETLVSPLDFNIAMSGEPRFVFDMDLRSGPTCSTGEKFKITGNLKQSEDFKEALRNREIVKKCKKEMKEGTKLLLACQQAIDLASTVNEIDVKIKCDSSTGFMRTKRAIESLMELIDSITTTSVSQADQSEDRVVRMRAKLSPQFDKAEVEVDLHNYKIEIKNIDLTEPTDVPLLLSDNESLDEVEIENSCVIDKNLIMTFDGKIYPLKNDKCSYVATTTYPKYNPDRVNDLMRIPESMSLNVIVQTIETDKKEIKLTLGDKVILLIPGSSRPEVLVDGKQVDYLSKHGYQQLNEKEQVMFEIGRLPGDAVVLISKMYGIEMFYDGERVRIKLSPMYKRSIRGLCGNFDDLPENDFLTPKNCVLKKPEEFAATYALKNNKCDSTVIRHAKMAEKSTCTRQEMRFSDVISAQEAGRAEIDGRKWGYHKKENVRRCNVHRTIVVPRGNEICFTMRPVPACSDECVPVEIKTKRYQLHCMPRNEASLAMKQRVEQGAHPDLSQHTPSGTHEINVPLECVAA